ncbi:hypothetical protein B5X24_HaOG211477 [Helicoverpa armigera]|nr:hypothetical protein B5X24_HaOG211477 [Helicoverpa armigera]
MSELAAAAYPNEPEPAMRGLHSEAIEASDCFGEGDTRQAEVERGAKGTVVTVAIVTKLYVIRGSGVGEKDVAYKPKHVPQYCFGRRTTLT